MFKRLIVKSLDAGAIGRINHRTAVAYIFRDDTLRTNKGALGKFKRNSVFLITKLRSMIVLN